MRTRIRTVTSALTVSLLLSACFTGDASEADGASEAGDRIRLGLAFPPAAAMSPYSDDAALIGRMGAGETLVTLDAEGTPQPLLAETWEGVDETTLRLTLREGVAFHDGTELTAEHVAASLGNAAAASPVPRALADTELSAVARDARTVEVTTARPDPILLQRLSSPELVILAPQAYVPGATAPDPVQAGTGPYVLEAVNGTSSATLHANPDYWGGEPGASGLDVRFISDGASRAGALRAGEVDIIDGVPISQLPNITEQEVVEVPLPRLMGIYLNTADRAFADPAIRAAARAAADPEAIANGIYEGRADAASGLFGPASPWSAERPEREVTEPGDLDGASITLATYEDRPELPEAASVVAQNLRDAGFGVDVVVQEYTTMETDLLAGRYDAVIGTRSYLLDTGDPVGYLSTDWSCDGSYTIAQFCDPQVDAAITKASAESDMDARRTAALDIEAQILGADAFVPLVHERARLGVAPGVEGVAQDAFERRLITAETTVQ